MVTRIRREPAIRDSEAQLRGFRREYGVICPSASVRRRGDRRLAVAGAVGGAGVGLIEPALELGQEEARLIAAPGGILDLGVLLLAVGGELGDEAGRVVGGRG